MASLCADFLGVSGPMESASRPLELTFVVIEDVVPWRYPPRCERQLGEWLRAEITSGAIPQPRFDPDLRERIEDALAGRREPDGR